MLPLNDKNIEAELSYAYLHAVAARAGVACRDASRHEDDNGIDAQLTAWGPWPDCHVSEVDLKVQLKACVKAPIDDGRQLSYFLKGVKRYDDLRNESVSVPRFLVVLFLPDIPEEWLRHSTDSLILRKCAYWVSLRGATPTDNSSGATIKIPKDQVFSPEGLSILVRRLARREMIRYQAP